MDERHLATGSTHGFINELLELASEDAPLHPGDRVNVEAEDGEFEADVVEMVGGHALVAWEANGTSHTRQLGEDDYSYVESSPYLTAVWERHLHTGVPDGVAWDDAAVSASLRGRLDAHFDALVAAQPADYHPGSGTVVRDLVHPSLYPYVEGRTKIERSARAPASPEIAETPGRPRQGSMLGWVKGVADRLRSPPTPRETPQRDFWGRPYEESRFQWLPTPFVVGEDGDVQIEGTINNLDRDASPGLYADLQALFAAALPSLESVFGYAQGTKFYDESLEGEHELPEPGSPIDPVGPLEPVSLRGRELQVITKIIEYRLRPGESFEGVWHVEGMSHEHILATAVYTVRRDEALQGGEIRFKRPYTRDEAGQLFWNVDQCRPAPVDEIVGEGVVPIGSLSTDEGRLFVFPNCHIHKLARMSLADGTSEARRRVVVFWLVHPDASIVSTRHVAPQQGVMPLEEALHVRLQLMEERRRHKQSLNVRAVSLCEH